MLRQFAEHEEKNQHYEVFKFLSTDKITITMTAEKYRKSIVDLVVQNGVALSLFSQPAFLELCGEMARRFGISLETQGIRKLVINEAADKKKELTETLLGRYLYLKMDAAIRHRVNYFAINARFVDDDGKNLTRTLAVTDTKIHHDSTYLQHVIEVVLEEYRIQKQQIVSIVADNASNMIKNIEKLNGDEDSNKIEKTIASDMAEQHNEDTEMQLLMMLPRRLQCFVLSGICAVLCVLCNLL